MYINHLNINEFRGIKSCDQPIEFSKFTVLIGRNNSGKSSILEALSLLPFPESYDPLYKTYRIQHLRNLHQPGERNNRLLYLYAGKSKLEYNLFENSPMQITIDISNVDVILEGDRIGAGNQLPSHLRNKDQSYENVVIFIPDTSRILNDLEERMTEYKDSIQKAGYHTELAELLNEVVNDRYSEIIFLEPISLRKLYKEKPITLRLKELGSGAEKVVKILALLKVLSPKLVIIDDFESGLHPALIKIFLKWLSNEKWQTIISTHSIDVLYSLIDIHPKDTTILQLNKSNEDILTYNKMTTEDLEDILNANLDPRLLTDRLNI